MSRGFMCAMVTLVSRVGGGLCTILVGFVRLSGVWITTVATGGGIWEKAWEDNPHAIGANEGSW